MTNYGIFLEDLKKLVHQYYGNGSFKDKRTGIVYKSGCLYYLDPGKVEFLSENGQPVKFSLSDLIHLEPIEETQHDKAMQIDPEPG